MLCSYCNPWARTPTFRDVPTPRGFYFYRRR
nr:MAG TPA: hypothetical protein [Caudoviricetes sp.]